MPFALMKNIQNKRNVTRIGKGIIDTAKGYIRDMAIGDTAGLRKVVNRTSQTIKEPKDGDGVGTTEEATEFMALMQTAIYTDQNLYYNVKGKDSKNKLNKKDESANVSDNKSSKFDIKNIMIGYFKFYKEKLMRKHIIIYIICLVVFFCYDSNSNIKNKFYS